jgi:hypothetical protein
MMPTLKSKNNNGKSNELSQFLESLDEETRKLLIKCLHINGESGDSMSEKEKIESLRAAL